MPTYKEGHIEVDPKSGEQWQVQNGAWVNIGPTVTSDVARSTFPELVRGAVNLGVGPQAGVNLAKRGIAAGAEKLGYQDVADRMRENIDKGSALSFKVPGTGIKIDPLSGPAMPGFMVDPDSAMNEVEKRIGGEGGMYRPQTTLGKYHGAVMQAIPGLAGGGGRTVADAVRNGVKTVTGALGGEAAGQAAEASDSSPWWRAPGAAVGSLIPSILRRGRTPAPANPNRLAQAANVEGAGGVKLGSRQTTGNLPGWLGAMEDRWRNSPTGERLGMSDQAQNRQVSEALMGSTGAPRTTPPTVENIRQQGVDLATERRDLLNRSTMPIDPQLHADIRDISNRTRLSLGLPRTGRSSGVPPPEIAGAVSDILGPSGGGTGGTAAWTTAGRLGPHWLELRDRLWRNAQAASSPAVATAHRDLRTAIDDAMHRAEPGFRPIHERMANVRALEQPGVVDTHGYVDPGGFNRAHSVSSAPAPTLARNFQAVTEPQKFAAVQNELPGLVGAGVGLGLGAHYGWAPGGWESMLPGLFVGGAMGRYAPNLPFVARAGLSNPVQGYLKNQKMLPGYDPTGNIARTVKILAGSDPLNQELEGYQ